MAVLCCTSMQLLLVALAALAGICLGGSDGPRGVALPFVFDPKATCDPPCKHAGICIRNNSCFCSRGYEGETCQYGEVSRYLLCNGFERKVCVCQICLYIALAKTHMICMLISANCYPKCKNGGECLRPGKCRCPSGFGGKYCHKGNWELISLMFIEAVSKLNRKIKEEPSLSQATLLTSCGCVVCVCQWFVTVAVGTVVSVLLWIEK